MDQQQYKVISGLAIAGMVCGIISLIPIGLKSIVLAIVAIVLSAVAKSDIKTNNKSGSGFATAGIVCGIITLVLWFLFFFVIGSILLSANH
ncbi:DUF4190 domain-containing protein [Gilliamella sp. B2772]|uniref:DUF4190 domain-containing protein n=1 Tax=Gilliamella sp. B2772 TaxID=2817981 RepID=UPI00226AAF22|nr:DUF4190 domain-containing protein [Gilliamella sp. B2772]MCX8660156.1 DUF4190 domain-containing protein [Gilliamella sp. B2772]